MEQAAVHRSAAEVHVDVSGQLELKGSVDAAPSAAERY